MHASSPNWYNIPILISQIALLQLHQINIIFFQELRSIFYQPLSIPSHLRFCILLISHFNLSILFMEQSNRIWINSDIYYYENSKIGSGAFGDVYKGTMLSKNAFVAIKRMILDSTRRASLEKEIIAMKEIKHPNIVRYYDCIRNQQANQCFIILEFCEGGTLQNEIKANGKIPEMNCLQYVRQIVDAMATANAEKFIHRDLKTQNILLTKSKTIKICDFGLARKVLGDSPNDIMKMTNLAGTPLYMAPEVLMSSDYSAKCDVWSVGVILYEMCTGKNPFHKVEFMKDLYHQYQIIQINKRKQLQGNYNEFFKSIVRQTLVYDQTSRISMNDLRDLLQFSYDRIKDQLDLKSTQTGMAKISVGKFPEKKSLKDRIKILEEHVSPKKGESGQITNSNTSTSASSVSKFSSEEFDATQMDMNLQHEEKSLRLYENLRLYIDFLYSRCQLFTTFADYLTKQPTSSPSKCQKYILLTISMAVYNRGVEQLDKLIKSERIELPNGDIVKVSSLHPNVKAKLATWQKGILANLQQCKTTYKDTLQQLCDKFKSPDYQKEYASALFEFKHIINQLEEATKNGRFPQGRPWFENQFRKFFRNYYKPTNGQISQMSESFLRTYWGCLKLADVDNTFSLARFQNTNLFGQFCDSRSKKSTVQILNEIGTMRQKLTKP